VRMNVDQFRDSTFDLSRFGRKEKARAFFTRIEVMSRAVSVGTMDLE